MDPLKTTSRNGKTIKIIFLALLVLFFHSHIYFSHVYPFHAKIQNLKCSLEFLKCEKYGKLDFLITIVFFRIALLKFGNSQLNYTYSINYIIRNSNKMPFKVRMKII